MYVFGEPLVFQPSRIWMRGGHRWGATRYRPAWAAATSEGSSSVLACVMGWVFLLDKVLAKITLRVEFYAPWTPNLDQWTTLQRVTGSRTKHSWLRS